MIKRLLLALIINFIFILGISAKEPTFVSLSPALTEIMYAIGAQNMLKAVSESCTYPETAKEKEKIGNSFFINEEKILKIKPDYILASESSKTVLQKFEKYNIKPLCLKNNNIKEIEENILFLGKLTNREQKAKEVVNSINNKIKNTNTPHNKRILYLVQSSPMITIGQNSFITDAIEKSGNQSITKDLKSAYPIITEEFAIKQTPDIVIVAFGNTKNLTKLFPKSKIIHLNSYEKDILNRPSVRIYKSVEFFIKNS